MTRKRLSSSALLWLLLPCLHSTTRAFQPEIMQAMEAAANTFSVDAVLFAAVNVLDPQRRPLVMEAPTISVNVPNLTMPSKPNITMPRAPNISFPSISLFGEGLDTQPLSYTITLTEEEVQLFELIRKVRDQCCPRTTLRIGGGWVRDKLLNRYQASPDIDFVIDNKSGNEFAKIVHDYVAKHREECSEISCELKDYEDVSQSQHLQTASLRIGDLWVDFNQLRFERYEANSRVPSKSGVASVVEDSFRRDLTINALYYNLNTNQVEDWTERGLRDLRLRNIRTTRNPLSTLVQDPLRILRAIRFSSQLSFGMDPTMKEAALDKRVKRSLQQKVSRERIGKEVDAIFRTADPMRGVQLLLDTKLVDLVFPLDKKEKNPYAIYKEGYEQLVRAQVLVSRLFRTKDQWSEEKRRLLWYAAFLMPLEEEEGRWNGKGSSSRAESSRSKLHRLIAKGLRQPVKDVGAVKDVVDGARVIQRYLRVEERGARKTLQTLDPKDDSTIAVVKEKKATNLRWLGYRILKRIGPHWRESLILALASSPNFAPLEAVDQYNELVSSLTSQVGLNGKLLDLKPVLDGSQIKKILPGIKGQHFKEVLMAQEKWQVENSVHGTTKADSDRIAEEVASFLTRTFPQFQ